MPASNGKRQKATVADFVVDRLVQWNVRRIFGYPGDGINGVLGAMNRRQGAIEFLQVAHEELASMMATAHAKFTGEVGVCLSTGGPGAIHLLNGLYDARLDHLDPKLPEKLAGALDKGDPDADEVRQQLVEQGIEGR